RCGWSGAAGRWLLVRGERRPADYPGGDDKRQGSERVQRSDREGPWFAGLVVVECVHHHGFAFAGVGSAGPVQNAKLHAGRPEASAIRSQPAAARVMVARLNLMRSRQIAAPSAPSANSERRSAAVADASARPASLPADQPPA